MEQVITAAQKLVAKMRHMPIGEWYQSYYHMLVRALEQPERNVTGHKDGDILFFSRALAWEISETGDAVYRLPEFKEFHALLDIPDAHEMSEGERNEYVEQTGSVCPAPIAGPLIEILKQRAKPN